MAESIYILCCGLSLACTVMLYRAYKKGPSVLLLWSSACFAMLALNNALLVVDLVVFPDLDFHGWFWRNMLSAGAGSVLLFGLIWELT